MPMSKQDFIDLADAIAEYNRDAEIADGWDAFTEVQLDVLARFCRDQNPAFKRERWIDYISGKCGSGGAPRGHATHIKKQVEGCEECMREAGAL